MISELRTPRTEMVSFDFGSFYLSKTAGEQSTSLLALTLRSYKRNWLMEFLCVGIGNAREGRTWGWGGSCSFIPLACCEALVLETSCLCCE